MTLCDGCHRPHQQVTEHITDDARIHLLCTPCWQEADAWDEMAKGAVVTKRKVAT